MATELEQQLFCRMQGDPSRLVDVLQRAHDEGIEVALPHQPLIDLLSKTARQMPKQITAPY